jgi:inner membrane protein
VDNLTHGLAGALLAQAGFRQRYGPMATVALVVGAELPDVDFLFDLGGPIVGFQNHRGITHAFTGGLGLALLAAGILYVGLRYRPYRLLVGLVYLGTLLHIWMDYLTSYGTQIFLPFDAGRYTADAVFIIDFFYTGLIVTALLLIRMVRRQRQQRYRAASLVGVAVGAGLWLSAAAISSQPLLQLALRNLGAHLALFAAVVMVATHVSRRWSDNCDLALGCYGSAALAVYMGLCMVSQAVAKHRFAAALAPHMAAVQRVAAIPLPGGPHRWRGIAETETAYMVSQIDLVTSAVSAPETVPKVPQDLEVVRATSDYRLVRIFRDFARFPVVEYRWQADERVVRYFDLRFTGYGRDKSWFDLEIRLDARGSVRGIRFLDRVFAPPHAEF